MERKLITPNIDDFPEVFHPLMKDAKIYDSSCSREARVVYIDRDNGYFLKCSPAGTLTGGQEPRCGQSPPVA